LTQPPRHRSLSRERPSARALGRGRRGLVLVLRGRGRSRPRHELRRALATTDRWPELPYEAWRDTKQTLHMYLQVVGKLRLALSPLEPQWGQVPLYLTARGLNTSPIPHPSGGFDVDVDFV